MDRNINIWNRKYNKGKEWYEGEISKVSNDIKFSGWIIVSINPNYDKQKENKYQHTPNYNLPYVIEVT